MKREQVKEMFCEHLKQYGNAAFPRSQEEREAKDELYKSAVLYVKERSPKMTKKEERREYGWASWLIFNTDYPEYGTTWEERAESIVGCLDNSIKSRNGYDTLAKMREAKMEWFEPQTKKA